MSVEKLENSVISKVTGESLVGSTPTRHTLFLGPIDVGPNCSDWTNARYGGCLILNNVV